ncbi:MAG: hypothetical protein NTV11_18095 [Rhodocyclales bacterium]|nr:hypothetical protein [Rhodocyclales bacterium]
MTGELLVRYGIRFHPLHVSLALGGNLRSTCRHQGLQQAAAGDKNVHDHRSGNPGSRIFFVVPRDHMAHFACDDKSHPVVVRQPDPKRRVERDSSVGTGNAAQFIAVDDIDIESAIDQSRDALRQVRIQMPGPRLQRTGDAPHLNRKARCRLRVRCRRAVHAAVAACTVPGTRSHGECDVRMGGGQRHINHSRTTLGLNRRTAGNAEAGDGSNQQSWESCTRHDPLPHPCFKPPKSAQT